MTQSDIASVILIGPIKAKGGIGSVMRDVSSSPLLVNKYSLRSIHTSDYKEGHLLKQILLFFGGLFRLIFLLSSRRIDLVHIHASSGKSFYRKLSFLFLAKFCRKKVIFHIHSGRFETFYYRNKSRICRIFTRFAFEASDAVVVLAERWKDLLSEFIPVTKIWVVHNPVKPFTLDLGFSEDSLQKNILFMGFLIKLKGVYDILRAIPLVVEQEKHAKFIFCGKGEEEEALRKTAKKAMIEDYVEFVGWVEREVKWTYFQKAHIFILPSYVEGLPISLLEAISVGLPVVSTHIGAIPEVVENGKNGFLIEPGNYKELAQNISKLIKDDELRASIRNNNLQVKSMFSIKTIAEKWDQLYERVLALP